MNTQTKKQIVMTLSEDEARAIVVQIEVDEWTSGEPLSALYNQLKAVLDDDGAADGETEARPLAVKKPRSTRIARKTASSNHSGVTRTCAVCGKIMKAQGIGIHMRRKHPDRDAGSAE